MNTRTWLYTLICAIALCTFILPARAAEEDDLIAALRPDRSPNDKDKACQRLKNIGTAKSVPALAALLTDEDLSHSARYALESMQAAEAGAALCDALGKTTGMTRIGIIDSIGQRREVKAVGALKGLLGDADSPTASAAASALGRIATSDAVDALRAAKPAASVRQAVDDALLVCAERLMEQDKAAAVALYREMHRSDVLHFRTAAFRGLALAAGDRGIDLVVQALKGDDAADFAAALQLVSDPRQWNDDEYWAAEVFAAVLPDVKPPAQIHLTEALAQRGSSAAGSAVRALLASPSADVRLAAIRALQFIADESSGPALIQIAARASGLEQDAARQSLGAMRNYCAVLTMEGMLYASSKSSIAERREIARALGQQIDSGMELTLYKLAKDEDASVQLAALRSLATSPDARVEALIPLLASATGDAERTAAEAALLASCTREKTRASAEHLILAALRKGKDSAVRAALLRVVGQVGGDASMQALRGALKDADPTIQDAALRTLSQFGPLNAADDLLNLAQDDARPLPQRVLALRGYWRIVAAASIPADQRIALCKAGLAASQRPEERRLGLAALARTPHADALKLAEQLAGDAAVRAEAQSAIIRIAAALGTGSPDIARAALNRVAQAPASDALRAEASKGLEVFEQFTGYIATWSVAGPYRQEGKQCMQLFDVAFAPETPKQAVKWRVLAPPADPALAWQVDMLPQADGEQCVIYARARVYSPAVRQVRLDIGSDDGMKLWINGQLTHAHNTQRPLQAMSDRAAGRLNEGWNDLLVKVTQNNMGFGFCLRIRAADGSVIEGLKSDNAMPQP
jgi:HEAT repeat protein